MHFLWQAVCNPERDAKVLQRGLPDGSQASQNSAEEQPLQNCQSYYGDTASGVSHLFQSSHPHGLFRQYIYKLVATGKLKASRISNRMSFIRKADIERMLEGNPYHRILPAAPPDRSNPLHLSCLPKKKRGNIRLMKCLTSIRARK